mgnify:CR=1 FL=1
MNYRLRKAAANGIVNGLLMKWGWIEEILPFWTDKTWARVSVILINIWIGIPHLMLMATGILMNIPADLYESAKVDGAGVWKQYTKITLPYMLFVTGPALLTSFVGNLNNFNVIYLLTGGLWGLGTFFDNVFIDGLKYALVFGWVCGIYPFIIRKKCKKV